MHNHWAIFRTDPKTGMQKSLVQNNHIALVKGHDAHIPVAARVSISGYKTLSDGKQVRYTVFLARNLIEEAAKELGLLPKEE